jgi:hypothetical protein
MGEIVYKPEEYQDLRTFFTNFETKDHEPVVFKPAAPTTASANPVN